MMRVYYTSLQLILILTLYSNTEAIISPSLHNNNKLHKNEALENPCYLKNYINPSGGIKGTGDYSLCYFILSQTLPKSKLKVPVHIYSSSVNNSTSFIFGEEFDDIADFLGTSRSTLSQMTSTANSTCALEFDSFLTGRNSTFFDICYKLTLDILIIENLIKQYKIPTDTQLSLIFYNNQTSSSDDYTLDFSEVPNVAVISLLTLVFIFTSMYIFKSYLVLLFKHIALDETLNFDEINYELIDSVMISIPVKTFVLNNFKDKIQLETENGPLDLKGYRSFFVKLLQENKNLQRKVEETLSYRNRLKSSIIFSIFFIVLILILSISTTVILSYVRTHMKGLLTFMYIFTSGLFMSLLVYESLKIISYYDYQKFYYSNIYSQKDKHFLEHEYIEYGLNIEIF